MATITDFIRNDDTKSHANTVAASIVGFDEYVNIDGTHESLGITFETIDGRTITLTLDDGDLALIQRARATPGDALDPSDIQPPAE